MSDAPERIWTDADASTICGSYDIEEYDGATEYIRADLLQAAVAAALTEAVESIGANTWRHYGEDDYSKGMDAGALHQAQAIRDAINRLITPDGRAALDRLRAADKARVAELTTALEHEVKRSRRHLAASTLAALAGKDTK